MTGFKGWEICASLQSHGLFISLSLLFSSLTFISFSVLKLTSPLVLTNYSRVSFCDNHMHPEPLRHFQLMMQPIESDITHGSHYGARVKLPGFVTIGRRH